MHKVRRILIVFIFIVIGMATSFTFFVFERNNMTIKISQEYYSDNAVAFFVSGSSKADMEYIMNRMDEGDILYGEIDRYSRGVYMKGDADDLPLVWGRGFRETDFFTNKKVALVGRKILEECKVIDGTYYFPIQNDLYEVIGVLGISSDSLLDNYMWINLDAMLNIFHSDGFYVLDGSKNCGEVLQDSFLEEIVEEVEKEEVGIKAMYENSRFSQWVCILLLVCLFAYAGIITFFWLEYQKYPVSIKKLCGIPRRYILWDLVKEFMILCCSGYLCGCGAAFLIHLW